MSTTPARITADHPRTVPAPRVWGLGSLDRLDLQRTVRSGSWTTPAHRAARLEHAGYLERRGPVDVDGVATFVPTVSGTRACLPQVPAEDVRPGDALDYAPDAIVSAVIDHGTHVAIVAGTGSAASLRYFDKGWPLHLSTVADHGHNRPF